jgi:PTS hybrid protein
VARVGLVVVSHSRPLAEAAVTLARQMLPSAEVAVEVAAGTDDGGLGTDAVAVSTAITAADSGDGVVVLMDLGSAVMSAETALELLDDEVRDRVLLSSAPLVEGLVGAVVVAAGGADRDRVAAEALRGLAPKQAHLDQ